MSTTAADLDIDQHRREHAELGLTIIRAAVPPDLLARLQVAAEELRTITRAATGPGTTRPPGGFVGGRVVTDYTDKMDTSAFAEWEQSPKLRAVIDGVLGEDFENDHNGFTMLFHAEDREIVQAWHRDYRDNVHWLDKDAWLAVRNDLRYFNQFNAALYHDISLWVVPGSHNREDTPEEAAVIRKESSAPPFWDDGCHTTTSYSQAADAYLRSMPGAYQVVLAPGDVAVYRDSAIHLGHYIPTIRRATLHGHWENALTRRFFEDHFSQHHDPGTIPTY